MQWNKDPEVKELHLQGTVVKNNSLEALPQVLVDKILQKTLFDSVLVTILLL